MSGSSFPVNGAIHLHFGCLNSEYTNMDIDFSISLGFFDDLVLFQPNLLLGMKLKVGKGIDRE